MWQLWRKVNLAHRLPSEVFGERNPLAAWMLDNCVLTFGTLIENALLEEDEIGSGESLKRIKRYTLAQLLDPEFRLPRPVDESDDFGVFMGVDGIDFDEVY
jgi:hypothetical protein